MATTEANNSEYSLKRKHSEMESNESNTEKANEEQGAPPLKKAKHESTEVEEEKKEDGDTKYGKTARQQRKDQRSGYTQMERNAFRRKQKQENKREQSRLKLEAMTDEERTKYFDEKMEKRKLKQKEKEMANEKLMKASKEGMKICIDLSFNKIYKKDMEYTNVIKQLCYVWNQNKRAKYAASVHLLNVDKHWNKYLDKQGIYRWKGINVHSKDILDAFADEKKENFVYLTPDSDNILNEEEFIKNKDKNIYIIGGIVDRVIQKNLTLNRANDLGIRHCKLPLHRLDDLAGRPCLNINAVFNMLLRFQDETEKWEDVMNDEMPNRNRKSAQNKKQRRSKSEQGKVAKPMFTPRSLHQKAN